VNFALFAVAICLKTMSYHHYYLSPQSTQRAQSGHMISNEYYIPDYNRRGLLFFSASLCILSGFPDRLENNKKSQIGRING